MFDEHLRDGISPKLRRRIYERDGYKCRYCGRSGAELRLDHVYPFSRWGETSYENLVTACFECNAKKRDKIGIWPKPLDYFEIRDCLIKLQMQSDEMVCNEEIWVTAEIRKIHASEGKLSLCDLGRIALKLQIDVLHICDLLQAKTFVRFPGRALIEQEGVERFLERARKYDKECKAPFLVNISKEKTDDSRSD